MLSFVWQTSSCCSLQRHELTNVLPHSVPNSPTIKSWGYLFCQICQKLLIKYLAFDIIK